MQLRVKVSTAGPGRTTFIDPAVATVPDQAPLPVQDVELVLDQLSVAVCPGITALGLKEMVTVALGGGVGVVVVVTGNDPEPQPLKTRTNKTNTITKE